ncbi:hypothetical protein B0T26DRAFT_719775 [Lasiosphaeria miniovina]|uniref:Uncharacterized protein n=1 Tax=Lasiosphaeria miniovina TaxID=1954250 RepID=A0AA40AE56_9PEZI|nr:uncharacterized protein B0T26DRAFT_719775 [Lasiosphaeria miniovina]KAK0714181.1 hypothetical protein B0T26DRAFT_719775 [Lasiosphaeria miniovina]
MAPNLEAGALFSVKGMVAVITGGGSGIGLVMSQALAANGAAKVYILGRRLDVLEEAAAATSPANVLVPVRCDVTSKESLQAAVDTITRETGFVNLLLVNSGVIGPLNGYQAVRTTTISDLRRAVFTDMDAAAMTETMHVNVTGAFFTMAAFLELLDAGNKHAVAGAGFDAPVNDAQARAGVPSVQSQVVYTSSISGYSRDGLTSPPAYASSKAAVLHLTKLSSSSLAKFGIRVNAIAPGLFPSEMAKGIIGNRTPETEELTDQKFIPARRFGTEEDMAGTILYLASRAGGFCNGTLLVMDGGRLSQTPSAV